MLQVRGGVALVLAAFLVVAAMPGCAGGPGNGCNDTLMPRSIDLMKFCQDSGKCQYDGTGCGSYPHCPYGTVPIDATTSWVVPLDQLGNARAGLSVLTVDLLSGAPLSANNLQVQADGLVVCDFGASADDTDSIRGKCPLTGSPSLLLLTLIGYHPALDLIIHLEEATPTQHVTVCGG